MLNRFMRLVKYGQKKAHEDGVPIALVTVLQILLNGFELWLRRRDAHHRKLPAILVNTLPKSGSMFIVNSLADIYHLHPVCTGEHGFPYSPLNDKEMARFAIGCSIDQGHYMPSVKNLSLLKKHGIDKLVVHFRDPRQALVSWVFYVDKYHEANNLFDIEDIDIPLDYFDRSFEEKMDIMIDLYYPHFIGFIDAWLAYVRDGKDMWGIDVLITEFRQMRNDPSSFFEDIRRFYDLPAVEYQAIQSPSAAHSHDRKGELEEWREVLTPEQVRRTSAMISDEMVLRLGWCK